MDKIALKIQLFFIGLYFRYSPKAIFYRKIYVLISKIRENKDYTELNNVLSTLNSRQVKWLSSMVHPIDIIQLGNLETIDILLNKKIVNEDKVLTYAPPSYMRRYKLNILINEN